MANRLKDATRSINNKLIDRYNRHINYLRISITDRCNLKCVYCASKSFTEKLPHSEILNYEEILRIVKIGIKLGISKVRVTGGEPLFRRGVYNFLSELSKIDGLCDISLTTNGLLLKDNVEKIRLAGIKRINVSMDTLLRRKYKKITGQDSFDQVWAGIKLAYKIGMHPIKLNVVAIKGINDDELEDIARLSICYPFHIRFIEYMPIGTPLINISPLLAPEIKQHISTIGILIPVEKGINDGPAERYKFQDSKGEVGFIRPLSGYFCYNCNRLRLTASGQIRSCLLSDYQEDIKSPLRKGCSDDYLSCVFLKAVYNKPFGHKLINCSKYTRAPFLMSALGG